MLSAITPVVLTFNEEPNIGRTLERLPWAKRVVLVDSGSSDRTVEIARGFPNVAVFTRPFDSHREQWTFAVRETGIDTPWVLRLDADYILSDALIAELGKLDPEAPFAAYRIAFDYAIFGRALRASLYPPNIVLFRRGRETVVQQGHTERWQVEGPVGALDGRIVHDDWKTMPGWVGSQVRYMEREHALLGEREGGLKRRLRLAPPLMPIAVFLYALFGKGLIFNGRAGIFYALQRLLAETILSLLVLEERLRDRKR